MSHNLLFAGDVQQFLLNTTVSTANAEAENCILGQQQKLGEKVWGTFARLIEILYE